jgi:predicted phosphoribosyltransferase
VVDDGLASGFSMLTTVQALKNQKKSIVVAVPTASLSAINLVKPYLNKIFCLNIRSGRFFAVAEAYKSWYDLNDQKVIKILKKIKFL